MPRLEVKYVVLILCYLFLCVYLSIQYFNGTENATLEHLKNEAQAQQYEHIKELSVEIDKNYVLMEKYKRLKLRMKSLKSDLQNQGKSSPSQGTPPNVHLGTQPIPNVQDRPNPPPITLQSGLLPPEPHRSDPVIPSPPIQAIPPTIIKSTDIPVHHDKDKYTDIDVDVHTQIEGDNVIPIVIFTYDRAEYLEKTLNTIFKYMPSEGYAVFVSQDGGMQVVTQKIQSYGNKLVHLQHPRDFIVPPEKKQFALYHAISQHYKWALEKIFSNPKFNRVIILEEDIEIAPDFFDYFTALSPLMDKDKSIYCISCWNDNGQAAHVKDPNVLYRSDFFPGLGWMMSREIWEEMKPKWPLGFWDDWLRRPENRKDRVCIYPEISRTYTFGARGVSGGQFFESHLKTMKLNDVLVPWRSRDISYLVKEKYDPYFEKLVNDAILLKDWSEVGLHQNKEVKLSYNTLPEYTNLAAKFSLMGDWKKGIPRGAYKGIVAFRHGTNRVFLVPTRPNLTYESV
jgi:alpha-1,3-mannosyl-glycoprotein beta-1,2-N-acetylglucosaminyltransferase